ncbi:hypothetical protein PPSIR1_32275 [Plesiocystis pacifica SIR-1]|uniref:YbjN domain-containing protein n=2 Tax=Plesiocystis pacifica TaxID=191768 RepID=A6GIJ5_9BACT|nr:hypothetical protein PPSIR1_32275 [Plesiocystis pacifica SIR-1]
MRRRGASFPADPGQGTLAHEHPTMSSSVETVEMMLLRSEAAHDLLAHGTWVVELDNARRSKIVVKVDDPIVLFSVPLGVMREDLEDREGLFRALLEFNFDLMHAAYSLHGQRVMLSGALETENLDENEFRAVMDDIAMALDQHLDTLTRWQLGAAAATPEA